VLKKINLQAYNDRLCGEMFFSGIIDSRLKSFLTEGHFM